MIGKRILFISMLSLISLFDSLAQQSGAKAGEISADVIKLEVDQMSPFYGKFAVIHKSSSQALINEKGEFVIPFNQYKFGEEQDKNFRSTGRYGFTFFGKKYYGSLGNTNQDADPIKLISFIELKSGKHGYLKMSGEQVFNVKEKDKSATPAANWLQKYDEEGFYITQSYPGLFRADGKLVSEKFDGTVLIGKGNYLNNNRENKRINYSIGNYYSSPGTSKFAIYSNSGWTNGLLPASYPINNRDPDTVIIKDPVKEMEKKNKQLGFINRKGEFQISPGFYSVSEFSEGLSFVSKIDQFGELKWGAIDTLGKLVIPFNFRSHPSRFSHGLAMVKAIDLDKIDYAFINKQGNIIFTIPKNSGDTVSVQFGFYRDYYNQPYYHPYDLTYFTEGHQFVRINLKANQQKQKYFTYLLNTQGKYIPIEQLINEKLPSGGNVEIIPNIKNGEFLFRFTRSVYGNGGADANGHYDGFGIANLKGEIVIPPIFQALSLFERESKLQYAKKSDLKNASAEATEGYIDRAGIFRIIKTKRMSGF